MPVSGRFGQQYQYRLAWDGQEQDGKCFVLGLKDVADLKQPRTGNPER